MLESPGPLLDVARQEFQGHRMPQFQIIGPIDLAHPAPAGERHDAIPLGDFGSGQEAAVDGGIRVGRRRWFAYLLPDRGGDRRGRRRFEGTAAARTALARLRICRGTGWAGFHGSSVNKTTASLRCSVFSEVTKGLDQIVTGRKQQSPLALVNGSLSTNARTASFGVF